ncbi:MAG: hypothetical protein JXA57_02945, partial [Armatimonadetes bacterium]|nr:hypothetical protein [Armatimonadota bacterium]
RGSPPVGPTELLVIPTDGGEAKTVAPGEPSEKWYSPQVVFWRDDDTLEILASGPSRPGWEQWLYRVGTEELEFVGHVSAGHGWIGALLETPSQERTGTAAILGTKGVANWSERYGLDTSAAVSPDGNYVVIRGKREPMVLIEIDDGSLGPRRQVPRTDLLSSESVSERDLCWSPDSKYFTFTEVHSHPARFHAFDIGGEVSKPWDTTYLVRLYSVETNDVQTIALGSNAFLLPDDLSWAPEAEVRWEVEAREPEE